MDKNLNGKIGNKRLIFHLIGFAIRHRRIMQSCLGETGVYQSQHRLLMEISCRPEVSQCELARFVGVSAPSVAVSLKKLEKGGYISREVDQEDNRFNKITITAKGNAVVEQSKQIFETTDAKVFQGFTEEEKQSLFALLQKLEANLARMEDEIKERV
ncbi:MAG TPA: MarR family transcriptional regulator [Limnochordia bacterium]|nr:MarR family transcriptional regulator [Limnochordia bacterium]